MLLAAIASFGLPRAVCHRARAWMGVVLLPGQALAHNATATVLAFGRRLVAPPPDPVEIQRLRDEVRQLREAVHAMGRRSPDASDDPARPAANATPLLQPVLRPAAVIGRDAAALLRQERLLGAGSASGVHAGALALGATALDQGQQAGVQAGHMVFVGRSVVGRIQQSGPYTSALQLITDPGFRALVEVQRLHGGRPQPVTRGILVGDGHGQCLLTRVAAGEDLRVGDHVVTTGHYPLLHERLAYGRIARFTHQDNALYWHVVVQPTAPLARLRRVFVLGATIHPDRLAHRPGENRL